MDVDEREHIFEQALTDFREGRTRLAASGLEKLVEGGSRDPAHLSYYGLVKAVARKDASAIGYCEEAVDKNGRRAGVLYLNLARALTAVGRRGEAIQTIRRGLLVHRHDFRLRREFQHLVPRATPTFPSLGRKHALNRYMGKARTWGGRLWLVVARPRQGV